MTTGFNASAAITMAIALSVASCAAHHGPAASSGTTDPLGNRTFNEIHRHGDFILRVSGQLACVGNRGFTEARVLARRYRDSRYVETQIAVDTDGRFHGELLVSWGGTGSEVELFPGALVFTMSGCRDTIVPDSDSWPEAAIELDCA